MTSDIVVEIGGVPVLLRTADRALGKIIGERFANFVTSRPSATPFEMTLRPDLEGAPKRRTIRGKRLGAGWQFGRCDFHAEWSSETGRGVIRQEAGSGYPADAFLRIFHSLLLPSQRGFLLHSATLVRNGSAFAFCGVSGAGKTTMCRLAPPEVTLLSDEISYIRPAGDGYRAFGTPFASDLGRIGENVSAPLKALYLLAKGPQNKSEPMSRREAAASLLHNAMVFTDDAEISRLVFEAALDLVMRVPVYRLTFVPTPEVWETIT